MFNKKKLRLLDLLNFWLDNRFIDVQTGCRLGEINNLKWENITNDTIEFNGKTGNRFFPLNDNLKELLEEIPEQNEYFLANENGLWLGAANRLTKLIKNFMKKAELPDHFVTHSLRHTFCSHLVINGVDLYKVSKLVGHSNITTTQRYAHLNPSLLKISTKYF